MKKILYICLFGFMCFSAKLLINWSEKGHYIIEQGRVFDTRQGAYVAQMTNEESLQKLDEHRRNMDWFFLIIGVVGVVGIIFGIGYWNGREKDKDLILRITADYETFDSFKVNYPEWSKLSYKVKHAVRSFYDYQRNIRN